METAVLVALIAAFASLIVSIIGGEKSARAQRELELLRNDLKEEGAEQDARRDYEYEARKRLYAECEPLLFQLGEAAGGVINRVQRIAEASRQGHLRPGIDNWFDGNGYFMRSTMYRMIAPHVYVRLLQEALTGVDLSLDPAIRHQYRLGQAFHWSLAADFEHAASEPSLPYDPNHQNAAVLTELEPAVYARQGLYSGMRDVAVEALIVRTRGCPPRGMSYGEFEVANEIEGGPVRTAFRDVYLLFLDFQPAAYPVQWRILITQALICHELRLAQASRLAGVSIEGGSPGPPRDELNPLLFDWRYDPGLAAAESASEAPFTATDETVLKDPFDVGRRYLEHQMSR